MDKALDRLSRLITARPWLTIAVLVIVTVALGAGAVFRAPPTEGADVAFLPPGHPMAEAVQEIDELFGDSGEVRVATVIFRGDALTPGGLAQMDGLLNEIAGDPAVGELLAPTNPVAAPSLLVKALLQVDGFESVTPDAIAAAPGPPEIKGALDAMTGTDADGTAVAIAVIRLRDTATNGLRTRSGESTNWRRAATGR